MKSRALASSLALVVLAAAAFAAWRFTRTPEQPLELVTAAVVRRDITATVAATGTLEPIVKVVVGSQVSGRIQKLFADYNQKVKEGQLLAQIEPSAFRARVDQAAAQVAKGRAGVLDAERTFQRSRELFDGKIGSQSDLDSARTKLELARADLQQSDANLKQARVDLDNTRIYSPITGIVISRDVDEGQTVAASLQAPTLFTIADDLSKLQIVANVDEADVGQVSEGQDVTFTVDAYPQSTFKGSVALIRNRPETVQNVVTYETVVHVQNPEQRLRPGMTTNVSIVVARKKATLALPNAALRFRPPDALLKGSSADDAADDRKKGKRARSHVTVWKSAPTGPTPEKIKVGITDGAYTEVKEGLAEKDLVVVGVRGGGDASTRGAGTPLSRDRKAVP